MDRGMWNQPYPDPRLQMANGSRMFHVDHAAVGRANPMPYIDTSSGTNNHASSNISATLPNHMAANPGPPYNPQLHVPSSRSCNQLPPSYNHYGYDYPSVNGNPEMEYGRVSYKRKYPDTYTEGYVNRVYSGGSSSSYYSIPSSSLHPNHTPDCQPWALDSESMLPGHRTNNVYAAGEGSYRSVTSRQSYPQVMENSQIGTHSLSHMSHHHPATIASGGAAARPWNHSAPICLNSQRRTLSSGSDAFNHEMSRHLAGSSSANHNMLGRLPYTVENRTSSVPLPTLHSIYSQVAGVGQNIYSHRSTPYDANPSYQPMGYAASLEDGRRFGMEVIPPPTHLRPLSIIERGSQRNVRPRTRYDSFPPFVDEVNSTSRWILEGSPLLDHLAMYETRDLYDQYHDMRLDIDHMSYEELLALEERIGNVSTGLSEKTVYSCLKEWVYYSSDNCSVKGNCAICLEEYKHEENLGKLKCGHDFHADCIKEWLLIKNACPICKGAAMPDPGKEI